MRERETMIRSRNLDPEAGKWSAPVKLASSTTASFAWINPTANTVYVDKILINVTTAAASKTIFAGVSSAATATNTTNELLDGVALTTGNVVESNTSTVVAKGSYIVGTLNATDATLDANVYVHYKELTK